MINIDKDNAIKSLFKLSQILISTTYDTDRGRLKCNGTVSKLSHISLSRGNSFAPFPEQTYPVRSDPRWPPSPSSLLLCSHCTPTSSEDSSSLWCWVCWWSPCWPEDPSRTSWHLATKDEAPRNLLHRLYPCKPSEGRRRWAQYWWGWREAGQ